MDGGWGGKVGGDSLMHVPLALPMLVPAKRKLRPVSRLVGGSLVMLSSIGRMPNVMLMHAVFLKVKVTERESATDERDSKPAPAGLSLPVPFCVELNASLPSP